ncbi:MAG: hypothetical protein HGJ94_03180 [Desulfosarcina sp.]|nr:hypothetical protein [Desulfosarcina sp.]
MKLLLLIIIAYLAYRAGKSWLIRHLRTPVEGGSRNPTIDDMMVKDRFLSEQKGQ